MSVCATSTGIRAGYTVVKDYVRPARLRRREAFVPLSHPPGHAQVDFGQCIGFIGRMRTVMHVFCMDLPHSDAPPRRPGFDPPLTALGCLAPEIRGDFRLSEASSALFRDAGQTSPPNLTRPV